MSTDRKFSSSKVSEEYFSIISKKQTSKKLKSPISTQNSAKTLRAKKSKSSLRDNNDFKKSELNNNHKQKEKCKQKQKQKEKHTIKKQQNLILSLQKQSKRNSCKGILLSHKKLQFSNNCNYSAMSQSNNFQNYQQGHIQKNLYNQSKNKNSLNNHKKITHHLSNTNSYNKNAHKSSNYYDNFNNHGTANKLTIHKSQVFKPEKSFLLNQNQIVHNMTISHNILSQNSNSKIKINQINHNNLNSNNSNISFKNKIYESEDLHTKSSKNLNINLMTNATTPNRLNLFEKEDNQENRLQKMYERCKQVLEIYQLKYKTLKQQNKKLKLQRSIHMHNHHNTNHNNNQICIHNKSKEYLK